MNCGKVQKLQVQNFRNLNSDIFEFVSGINCIFGKNGNGKTNLLEAIYFLTNKKSFRKNTSFPQMMNIEGDKPEIIIQSVFDFEGDPSAYSIRWSDKLEERFWNSKPEKTKTPSASVFVNPFDSYSFHTSGTFRRQWMDSHLGQLDPEYKKVLNRFQKAIKFRNSILSATRYIKDYPAQLKAIDLQVCEYSEIITKKRADFLQNLNNFISPTFKAIFAEEHQLKLELDSMFLHWNAAKIYDFYRSQERIDVEAQVTQVGIHRDDYIFSFDGLNSFEFCSLGQQKMSFLSLIFGFIELFESKFNSYPIVLIDDVSGELDGQRWKNLVQYLEQKSFQVLITTANENFKKELENIKHSRTFFLDQGTLSSNQG